MSNQISSANSRLDNLQTSVGSISDQLSLPSGTLPTVLNAINDSLSSSGTLGQIKDSVLTPLATVSGQTSGNASLSSMDSKLSTLNSTIGTGNTSLSSINSKLPSGLTVQASNLQVVCTATNLDCLVNNWQYSTAVIRSLDVGTTSVQIFSGAGYLHKITVANQNLTTKRYLKCYQSASATQASTPIITIVLQSNSTEIYDCFLYLSSGGFCVRATTAIADNDTGSPSANDVVISVTYKQ